MDQHLITRIVEAALLAASQPLTLAQLHGLFPLDEPAPDDSVERALEVLREGCAGRGIELVELASGYRFQVQADVHPWVARLWSERQTKYTRATLETLALIAYRQPITRGEIEQVRGVSVNSNIIKALEEREWIRVVGHRDIPGRPELLGTTRGFLDYFGLKRLDELPPLSELKDFGELEPQFQFNGEEMPIGDIALDGGALDGGALDGDAEADGVREGSSDATGHDIDESTADHQIHDAPDKTDGDQDATDFPDYTETQDDSNDTALAEDGDSTGARHE
ncbi:MAG: SMC-Scp complex subunit ScpB [Luteimonas sp.]|nr:SMC-Scp complex subunit ScpB [Luteimonas sp.]